MIGVGDSMVGRLMDVLLMSLTADYVEMSKQAVCLWRYLCRGGIDADITVSIAWQMNRKNIVADVVYIRRHLDYQQGL